MLAQNLDIIAGKAGLTKLTLVSVADIIEWLIPYFLSAAGIALLVYLILGGFQLMTSKGDPKAAEGAKGKITNAIIGFVIIFTAYWIVQIIGQVFKIEVIQEIFT